MSKKVALIIMDGWGKGDHTKSDAIFNANTPFVDSLYNKPNSELITSGEEVGLPEGMLDGNDDGDENGCSVGEVVGNVVGYPEG